MTDDGRGLLQRALSWLDDRMNPILVKEVRQSLRGMIFKIFFWLTLVAATMIGIAVILTSAATGDIDEMGQVFFTAIYVCLVIAVQGLVPFMAFLSMGSEWDENTYDLLALSNLRPRQIVFGKLLSACALTMLFFSAMGPFLVFAFLLRGVDLFVILFLISHALVASIALCVMALCLSSLTRVRFARVLLLAALAGALFYACGGSIFMGVELVDSPHDLLDKELQAAMAGMYTVGLTVAAFAFAVACSRLAHEEENRSTGLRVLGVLAILGGLGWVSWAYEQITDVEFITAMGSAMIFLSMAWTVFFVTEDEKLGVRIRRHVPRNPILAALATPFLPGGGRGMVYLLLQAALIVAGILAIHWTKSLGGDDLIDNGGLWMPVALLYVMIYVALPSGLLAKISDTLKGRVLIRVSIPLLFLVGSFLPAVLGFFVEDSRLMEMKHPGHPFWFMSEVYEGDLTAAQQGTLFVLVALGGIALLVNLPRIAAGIREIQVASAALRRERAQQREPAPEGPPDAVAES